MHMRTISACIASSLVALGCSKGITRPTEPSAGAATTAAPAPNRPPDVIFSAIYNVSPVQYPPLRSNASSEALVYVVDDEPLPPVRDQCVGARVEGTCSLILLDCTTLAGITLYFRTNTGPGNCTLYMTARDARGAQTTGSATVAVGAPIAHFLSPDGAPRKKLPAKETSPSRVPASASRKAMTICSGVKRLVLIGRSPSNQRDVQRPDRKLPQNESLSGTGNGVKTLATRIDVPKVIRLSGPTLTTTAADLGPPDGLGLLRDLDGALDRLQKGIDAAGVLVR